MKSVASYSHSDHSTRGHFLLSFPPFQLDPAEERFWKAGKELRLRRKPFAILLYFTGNPGRLVTHENIVAAVWGRVAMSESLLRTHVHALRQVLGDGIIETVVGRGYRFMPDVREADPSADSHMTSDGLAVRAPPPYLVGRTAELDALRAALQNARDRKRQIVFVTGEAGVGKTTLVDAFLAHAASIGTMWSAFEPCVEQYGSGEAYLPVVAALGRLCNGPGGERVVDVLSRHAPTWLAQMPGLLVGDRAEELQRRIVGATQPRMLRELAEALEALSSDETVVMALDDLQWSDQSTAELLAMLARRREPARLLVVGTYRPAELGKTHPLTKVLGELIAHKQAAQLPIDTFSEETVAEYVDRRFIGHEFPRELASTVHQTTGGNPLFVVALFDDLESRQMIRGIDGRLQLATSVEDVAARRPDSIRRLIDVQIDRLGATEQRILEVASVAGNTFAAGVVAYALDLLVDDVDSCCESFANRQRFLRYLGDETWPDGTIQSRYGFAHALYQDAALARNPSASVRLWHRRIAERLEAGHPDDSDAIAPELAVHLDEGHVFSRAARYYTLAGERAGRRHGNYEALLHFERARTLVGRLPEGREREELELRVLSGLGLALIAVKAMGAEAVAILSRAAEVASRLARDQDLCAALIGLQRCRLTNGELREVSEHAEEITPIAGRIADPSFGEAAAFIASVPPFYRGRLCETERTLTLFGSRFDARRGPLTEAAVKARGHLALATWLLGRPDEALRWALSAVSAAEAFGDPNTLTAMLISAGNVTVWRRNVTAALDYGRRALDGVSAQAKRKEEARLTLMHGAGRFFASWGRSQLDPASSAAVVDEILLARPWDGMPMARTVYMPMFVEICMRAGRDAVALDVVSEAMQFMEQKDERFMEPELYRLRGELLKSTDKQEAERCFKAAVEVARRQSSKSFELRATMSLYRIRSGAKKRKASEEVRRLVETFTEGFDTGDLLDAKTIVLAG